MEISPHSKRLYRHAAPLLLLGLLLLTVSAATFSRYSQLQATDRHALGRALTQPFIHVKPASNGLAHVTIDEQSKPPAPLIKSGPGLEFEATGHVAARSLLVQGVAADVR